MNVVVEAVELWETRRGFSKPCGKAAEGQVRVLAPLWLSRPINRIGGCAAASQPLFLEQHIDPRIAAGIKCGRYETVKGKPGVLAANSLTELLEGITDFPTR